MRRNAFRKMRRRFRRLLGGLVRAVLLALPALLMLMPVLLLLSGSLMSGLELADAFAPLSGEAEGYIGWKLLPDYPTLAHYGKLLLYSPQFFTVFWNSVKIVVLILGLQLLLAVPSAWAFAVYRFRFSRALFVLYIVLMLMPFQVTMLSQYLVLTELGLMDTHWALILPAAFSTFPVFLMYRSFREIPAGLLEAARIDGAGEFTLFVRIGLPLASGGILAAGVLGFLEYWNMIEQPLAFLRTRALWPLSLYLPSDLEGQEGTAFAASVIILIPALFVFLLGRDHLERGIVASALKE